MKISDEKLEEKKQQFIDYFKLAKSNRDTLMMIRDEITEKRDDDKLDAFMTLEERIEKFIDFIATKASVKMYDAAGVSITPTGDVVLQYDFASTEDFYNFEDEFEKYGLETTGAPDGIGVSAAMSHLDEPTKGGYYFRVITQETLPKLFDILFMDSDSFELFIKLQ